MWNPKQLSTWVSLPGSLPPSPPPSEHCLAEPAESDLSAPTFHFLHIFRQNQHRPFLYRAVDFNNCPICVCWLVVGSSWQEPNEFRSKIEILTQCKDNTWSHLQSFWTQPYRRCGALKPTYIFSGNFSCIVCLFVCLFIAQQGNLCALCEVPWVDGVVVIERNCCTQTSHYTELLLETK